MAKKRPETKRKPAARAKRPEPTGAAWLRLGELSEALGKDPRQVRRWVEEGMPCKGSGHARRFHLSAVRAWMEQRGRGGPRGGDPLTRGAVGALPDAAATPPASTGSTGSDPGDLDLEDLDAVDRLEGEELRAAYLRGKIRKDLLDAARKALELEKAKGLLVSREEVERGQVERIHACRAVLEAIPMRVAPRVVGASDEAEVEAIIRDAITEALEAFASGRERSYVADDDQGDDDASGWDDQPPDDEPAPPPAAEALEDQPHGGALRRRRRRERA